MKTTRQAPGFYTVSDASGRTVDVYRVELFDGTWWLAARGELVTDPLATKREAVAEAHIILNEAR